MSFRPAHIMPVPPRQQVRNIRVTQSQLSLREIFIIRRPSNWYFSGHIKVIMIDLKSIIYLNIMARIRHYIKMQRGIDPPEGRDMRLSSYRTCKRRHAIAIKSYNLLQGRRLPLNGQRALTSVIAEAIGRMTQQFRSPSKSMSVDRNPVQVRIDKIFGRPKHMSLFNSMKRRKHRKRARPWFEN